MAEEKYIEKLNELLMGENLATHIYRRTQGLQEDSQVAMMLERFKQDHDRHAEQLKQRITELGGTPKTNMGMAGVMTNLSSTINSIRGPEHLLKQIYNGEDKGVHAYEDRIDELDSESQDLVKQIMREDHDHLKYFKARMEKEKKERNKDSSRLH